MKFNKAAMFGLDARIALAIFGALSVISGAALYSAIQQSKTTSMISQLNELSKAYEQYILDTGEELPVISLGVYTDVSKLLSSSLTNWNGPYMSLDSVSGNDHVLKYPGIHGLYIAEMLDETWADENPATKVCVSGKVCSVYVGSYGISLELAKALDLAIDGVASTTEGNFKYRATGTIHVFWKQFPTLTQP
tara:strand:+ start:298 stop:873 length:576 start_codon:yes stop_codon:yes gene_type:complete